MNYSLIKSKGNYFFTLRKLPEQVKPFPEYPLLQAHVKEPIVLAQAAFALQLSVLVVHSSTSGMQRIVIHSAEIIVIKLYTNSQI